MREEIQERPSLELQRRRHVGRAQSKRSEQEKLLRDRRPPRQERRAEDGAQNQREQRAAADVTPRHREALSIEPVSVAVPPGIGRVHGGQDQEKRGERSGPEIFPGVGERGAARLAQSPRAPRAVDRDRRNPEEGADHEDPVEQPRGRAPAVHERSSSSAREASSASIERRQP